MPLTLKTISNQPALLVQELQKQYTDISTSEKVKRISRRCWMKILHYRHRHQPNIFTGYLYFVYKILHTVKLAAELKQQMPGMNFVPVFYMGSEDADLEELGKFLWVKRLFGIPNKRSAVGR